MQPPGKIAAMCSVRLQGKHKPIYHALSDVGDHVVVMNTIHIAFSGNKWEQKVYSSHTGYPGGFKQVTAAQMHRKDPTAIIKLAVYGMLPKNLKRRTMMQRLHLFTDDVLPEDILTNLTEELPQPRAIPRKLSEYTQAERDAFPQLWTIQGSGAETYRKVDKKGNQRIIKLQNRIICLLSRADRVLASCAARFLPRFMSDESCLCSKVTGGGHERIG
ncbi:39S ribosomal protein L13, mitochondrial [Bagarius yarrelli]|uniref:Large ribosomal subunit protein uL13m n=1 Tax=Bagarius yarrelli TaxID=175774 RepID=A0A556VAL5_BAGYA|nr:39S ribosomal protein L13, mitochondrial [Bagarius yarrelli]